MKKEDILKDIIWGNKLYVNAQFVLTLVTMLTKYEQGEGDIQSIFSFAAAVKNQRNVPLYKELKKEIEEICYLQHMIHNGEVNLKDTNVIRYVFNDILFFFTGKQEG